MLKNLIYPILALSCALAISRSPAARKAGGGMSLTKEISGTVMHDGKAVPGATVVILGRTRPVEETLLPESTATTTQRIQADGEGKFTIQLPCWRFYSFYAELADKGLTSPLREAVSAPEHDLTLALAPAWNLEGKLVYRNRTPGEVIGMRLIRMSTQYHTAVLKVDGKAKEDGSFSFRGLPPGPWQLKLDGKKRRLASPYEFSEPNKKHEIPLARAYSLTVRVATARGMLGKNVANAKVQIIDTVQFYETSSDENGLFVLKGIEKGPGATFLMEAPGFAKKIYALEPGLNPKDPAPHASVQTDSGIKRRGRILDVMGNPAPGITVLFAGIIHPSGVSVGDLSIAVKTDKDGIFKTDALDPLAAFNVLALLPGGEPMKLGFTEPHRGKEDMGSFRMGSHRVRVVLRTQKDVMLTPDHKVSIYGPKESGQFTQSEPLIRTRGNEFRSASLLPGEYVVIFSSKTLGFSRRKVFVAGGVRAKPMTETQLLVTRPRLIEGTLVDSRGENVSNRQVQIVGAGGTSEGGSGDWTNMVIQTILMDQFPEKDYPTKVKSDAKGKFKIWCLETSGHYDLLVTRRRPMDAPQGMPPLEPMRVTNILGLASPIRIRIE